MRNPALTATLSPLTIWNLDRNLPLTTLWATHLIRYSACEQAGAMGLAFERAL